MTRTASFPTLSLHTRGGQRKYLTAAERVRFMAAAADCPLIVETLCLTLAWTGGRITEVLDLTHADLDADAGTIAVRCLKRRRDGVVREVPVPAAFLATLARVHGPGRPDDLL